MNTLELKNSFHTLIDSINNDSLLMSLYDIMKSRTSTRDGQMWNNLSRLEQEELLLALEESENPETLISNDDMKKKHKKWL